MEFRPVHFGTDGAVEYEYYDYRYYSLPGLIIEDLEVPIRIKQDWKLGKGGTLWDASYVLSRYLQTLALEGKNVIEFGSGTALPSMLCASKGANVTATDLSEVLHLTQENIALNTDKYTGSIASAELNWCEPSQRERFSGVCWDYIIMSDVFYLPVIYK